MLDYVKAAAALIKKSSKLPIKIYILKERSEIVSENLIIQE